MTISGFDRESRRLTLRLKIPCSPQATELAAVGIEMPELIVELDSDELVMRELTAATVEEIKVANDEDDEKFTQLVVMAGLKVTIVGSTRVKSDETIVSEVLDAVKE